MTTGLGHDRYVAPGSDLGAGVTGWLTRGWAMADVANDLGISDQTVDHWRQQERIDKGTDPGSPTRESAGGLGGTS